MTFSTIGKIKMTRVKIGDMATNCTTNKFDFDRVLSALEKYLEITVMRNFTYFIKISDPEL